MKEHMQNNATVKINKLLRYVAAALSVVSFLTTLTGINGIVTDNVWLAGLISFGIQAIILVMGLWFLPSVRTVSKKNLKIATKVVVIGSMILVYLCSTAFSSLFSYVYMANAAYADVRIVDYNMELEIFLVDNTQQIDNYNDAIYNLLLNKIRETAPEFQTLKQRYQNDANTEIQSVIQSISKYETATISETNKFSAEAAITTYNGANRNHAKKELQEDCYRLEQDINQYIAYYDEQFYPMYTKCYEEIQQHDLDSAAPNKAEITQLIEDMEAQKELLNSYKHKVGSIERYMKSKCNGIISQYNNLISALKSLNNGYDKMLALPSVEQDNDLSLQKFYEVLYSADIQEESDLSQVEADLQKIITAYISVTDSIDENTVSKLVNCVEWLSKLHQCQKTRERIDTFASNQLSQMHSISSSGQGGQVDESTWKSARYADLEEFISITKSIPDIDQILLDSEVLNDPTLEYLYEKEKDNYLSKVLSDARKYSRDKLENISSLERAWNYLGSETNFLAIICFLIAVFLDIASFFIGIIMYTREKAEHENFTSNMTLPKQV